MVNRGRSGLDNRLAPQRDRLVVMGGRFIRRAQSPSPPSFEGGRLLVLQGGSGAGCCRLGLRKEQLLASRGSRLPQSLRSFAMTLGLRAGRSKLSPNRRRFGTIFEAALGAADIGGGFAQRVLFGRWGGVGIWGSKIKMQKAKLQSKYQNGLAGRPSRCEWGNKPRAG